MNKFYAFLLIMLYNISYSQITISNSTFPEAGDTLKTVIDNSSSVEINPSTGYSNAFWDFSDLSGTNNETIYLDAINGINFSEFPNADLLVNTSNGEMYYSSNSTELEFIGIIGQDPVGLGIDLPIKISPAFTERKAPLDFSDSYTDNGSAIIPISVSMIPAALLDSLPIAPDSLRVIIDADRTNFVDGWGILQIPNGTYYVLREKRIEKRDTKIEARVTVAGFSVWQDITSLIPGADIGKDTITTYNFYGENSKELIANVTVDNNDNDLVEQIEYKQAFGDTIPDTSTNIFSLNNIYQLEIFPNPLKDKANFVFNNLKASNYELTIYDLLGKTIWEKKYGINNNITISEDIDFETGTYFYILKNKGSIISSNKFIVE